VTKKTTGILLAALAVAGSLGGCGGSSGSKPAANARGGGAGPTNAELNQQLFVQKSSTLSYAIVLAAGCKRLIAFFSGPDASNASDADSILFTWINYFDAFAPNGLEYISDPTIYQLHKDLGTIDNALLGPNQSNNTVAPGQTLDPSQPLATIQTDCSGS
jgi:hypothetical protein